MLSVVLSPITSWRALLPRHRRCPSPRLYQRFQHTDIIKVIAECHDVFHRPPCASTHFVKRLPLLLPPRANQPDRARTIHTPVPVHVRHATKMLQLRQVIVRQGELPYGVTCCAVSAREATCVKVGRCSAAGFAPS